MTPPRIKTMPRSFPAMLSALLLAGPAATPARSAEARPGANPAASSAAEPRDFSLAALGGSIGVGLLFRRRLRKSPGA